MVVVLPSKVFCLFMSVTVQQQSVNEAAVVKQLTNVLLTFAYHLGWLCLAACDILAGRLVLTMSRCS